MAVTDSIIPDQPTEAWSLASQWPLRNDYAQPWWQSIGPQLAALAADAGYSLQRQTDLLRFVHSHVVSRLGLQSPEHWLSLLTNDGTPLEYSWKWNTGPDSRPEIRYCIEAIGRDPLAASDRTNFSETEALLLSLKSHIEGLDLTWFDHFVDAFKLRQSGDPTLHGSGPHSSVFVAFEHSPKDVVTKVYFVPPTDGTGSGAPPTFATFLDAVRPLSPHGQALQRMTEFVKSAPAALKPDMLAIDCVDPGKSRIKLYAGGNTGTSIKEMLSIMSLGGKIKYSDDAVASLSRLVQQTLGLDHELGMNEEIKVQEAFEADLAHSFDLYANMVYYFDIAPKSNMPDVKLYIPVNRYGQSDAKVASGLAAYLHAEGRGQYADGFVHALKTISRQRSNTSGHRVQTFIAVAFRKDGTLDITSYLNPGMYYSQIKAKNARKH